MAIVTVLPPPKKKKKKKKKREEEKRQKAHTSIDVYITESCLQILLWLSYIAQTTAIVSAQKVHIVFVMQLKNRSMYIKKPWLHHETAAALYLEPSIWEEAASQS